AYVGLQPEFPDMAQAEEYVRRISAPFGRHSDAEWCLLTESWVRKGDDGIYRPRYDPGIAAAFAVPEKDLELWLIYDAVRCPTLGACGAASTSTCAARSPRPYSAMRPRCAIRRSPPSSASPRCSLARWTSSRATPPGPCRGTPASGSTSSASITMTARASWCPRRRTSGARSS